MSTKKLGDRGEDIAASFLEAQGYVILDRNYRFRRAEIDLVCLEPSNRSSSDSSPADKPPSRPFCGGADPSAAGEIVFAEIKTRSGLGYGHPEEAVSAEKQRHIVRAARAYLRERRLQTAPCRFDVIAIVLRGDRDPEIEHFKRAFWA
ncbi:MAG: YraN family protein [Rhodothermales bacterium]